MKRLVCESLYQFYKMNEDIETAKEIFADNNISPDSKKYIKFFELLGDVPSDDIDTYANWVAKGEVTPIELKYYLNQINAENIIIDKPINSFISFEDYEEEIDKKIKEQKEHKEKIDSLKVDNSENDINMDSSINMPDKGNLTNTKVSKTTQTLPDTKKVDSEIQQTKNNKNKLKASILGINEYTEGEDDELDEYLDPKLKKLLEKPYRAISEDDIKKLLKIKKLGPNDGILDTYYKSEGPKRGFYCLENLYNSSDMHILGQGIYIWTTAQDLFNLKFDSKTTLNDIPYKVGQYGSFVKKDNGEEKQWGKTPVATISDYIHAEMDRIVIIYAKRLDDYLKSDKNEGRFNTAYDIEKTVHSKIEGAQGYKLDYVRNTEMFSGISLEKIISIINETLSGSIKLNDFDMRDEQRVAHDKIVDYFRKGNKEFLLAAKMRFGKNFTFLNVAKTLNFKKILVLTYKPHVFDSLEKDVKNHVNFDNWDVIYFKENRNLTEPKKPTIYMSSAQMAIYKNQKGGVNEGHLYEAKNYADDDDNIIEQEEKTNQEKSLINLSKNLKNLSAIATASSPIDLIIADEYHYGTKTTNFNDILKALPHKHIIWISGTAMKDIEAGRFDDDQIYSYSYIEEQELKKKEKEKGYGSHLAMPTMRFHTIEICEEAKKHAKDFYTKEEGFSTKKMLDRYTKDDEEVKKGIKKVGDMIHVKFIENLLKQIMGGSVSHDNLSIFKQQGIGGSLDHTLWVFDKSTDGIIGVAKIMRNMKNIFDDYVIIPATGNLVTNIKEVQRLINRAKNQGKGTITLTCQRFKEGVTIPDWTAAIMLDNGSSVEEYLQAIFRCQSPGENKDECYVFDFQPQRCLSMIYDAVEGMDKSAGAKMHKTIEQFIACAPVIDHSENKLSKVITTEDIFNNFRSTAKFSEKFANKRNFNIDKLLNSNVKNVLLKVTSPKKEKGKEVEVTDNELEKAKNKEIEKIGGDKNKRKKTKSELNIVIEKMQAFLASLPLYLFCSTKKEENLKAIIDTTDINEIELLEEITGLTPQDIEILFNEKALNVEINRNIKYFLYNENKFFEDVNAKNLKAFVDDNFALRGSEGAEDLIIINQLLDKFPLNIWTNPYIKFCDPVCGVGTILLAIKERLLEKLPNNLPIYKNLSKEEYILQNMIYGYDIKKHKIIIAKKLLGNNSNIIQTDILNNKNDMKFDVLVYNPPYKREGNSNYYTYFNNRANDLLEDGGHAAIIMPNRFLLINTKASKSIRWLDVKYLYPSVNSYFPGIGTAIGAVVGIKNNDYNINKKIDYIYTDENKIIKRSRTKAVPFNNTTLLSTIIIDKILDKPGDKLIALREKPDGDFIYVDSTYCRYRPTTPKGGPKALTMRFNETYIKGSFFSIPNKQVADVNIWGWSRSTLGRYFVVSFATSSFVGFPANASMLPMLPEDLEKTDDAINRYFGIEPDEYKYMKEIVK